MTESSSGVVEIQFKDENRRKTHLQGQWSSSHGFPRVGSPKPLFYNYRLGGVYYPKRIFQGDFHWFQKCLDAVLIWSWLNTFCFQSWKLKALKIYSLEILKNGSPENPHQIELRKIIWIKPPFLGSMCQGVSIKAPITRVDRALASLQDETGFGRGVTQGADWDWELNSLQVLFSWKSEGTLIRPY